MMDIVIIHHENIITDINFYDIIMHTFDSI